MDLHSLVRRVHLRNHRCATTVDTPLSFMTYLPPEPLGLYHYTDTARRAPAGAMFASGKEKKCHTNWLDDNTFTQIVPEAKGASRLATYVTQPDTSVCRYITIHTRMLSARSQSFTKHLLLPPRQIHSLYASIYSCSI